MTIVKRELQRRMEEVSSPKNPTPIDRWSAACDEALEIILECKQEIQGDVMLDVAQDLLALAHQIQDVACSSCSGTGYRQYPSTALWRRGVIAGQAFTVGVCDQCWGTGRTDRKGIDIKALEEEIKGLKKVLSVALGEPWKREAYAEKEPKQDLPRHTRKSRNR